MVRFAMLCAQLAAPRRIVVTDIPAPTDPGPNEILVRLRAVGICGSDLHWFREGSIRGVPAQYPMVLGHEPAGTVAAIGPGVTRFAPGDPVAIEPQITCGHCEYCLAGQHIHCLNTSYMGSPQTFGLFREYAVIPAVNAKKFPASLPFKHAALIEPLAVILHMLELVTIRPFDHVAVIGAGPIGMLSAAVAHHAGARVLSTDRLPHRLELARRMGAAEVCDFSRFRAAALDLTNGRGMDLVIDAAADRSTIDAGFAVTKPAGTFMLAGIPVDSPLPVDLHAALGKEIRFLTLKRSNHRAGPALDMLLSGAVKTDLVTHTMPAERAPEAFDLLDNYRDGVGKMVIEFAA